MSAKLRLPPGIKEVFSGTIIEIYQVPGKNGSTDYLLYATRKAAKELSIHIYDVTSIEASAINRGTKQSITIAKSTLTKAEFLSIGQAMLARTNTIEPHTQTFTHRPFELGGIAFC
jgi:hypothetical protein